MRAEQLCRTLVLEFQTEPYSTSYGQKTFWRVPAKILKYFWGTSYSQKGESLFSQKGNPAFKKEHPAFEKGNPGGGEQVPPAVLLFENKDPFLHGSPGGGDQVPPAVLFFQNRHLFYTSPGGVVQVALGRSIF